MSRGGWYRSPDGKGVTHLLFGSGVKAPGACSGACLPDDDDSLLGGRCARIARYLCDFPVAETIGGKPITCDAAMCDIHRSHVGKDTDYCPKHDRTLTPLRSVEE